MSTLDLSIHQEDVKVDTLGSYLAQLLNTLIKEEEGFDSKRPFGNSDWESDVEDALEKAGNTWDDLFFDINVALGRDKTLVEGLLADFPMLSEETAERIIEAGWHK